MSDNTGPTPTRRIVRRRRPSRRKSARSRNRLKPFSPNTYRLCKAPGSRGIPQIIAYRGIPTGTEPYPREFSFDPFIPETREELEDEPVLFNASILNLIPGYIWQTVTAGLSVGLLTGLSFAVNWVFGVLFCSYCALLLLIPRIKVPQSWSDTLGIVTYGSHRIGLAIPAVLIAIWVFQLNVILGLVITSVSLILVYIVERIRFERKISGLNRLAFASELVVVGILLYFLPPVYGLSVLVAILVTNTVINRLLRPNNHVSPSPILRSIWINMGKTLRNAFGGSCFTGVIVSLPLAIWLNPMEPLSETNKVLVFAGAVLLLALYQAKKGFDNWHDHIMWWINRVECSQLRLMLFTPINDSLFEVNLTIVGSNEINTVRASNSDPLPINLFLRILGWLPQAAVPYANIGTIKLTTNSEGHDIDLVNFPNPEALSSFFSQYAVAQEAVDAQQLEALKLANMFQVAKWYKDLLTTGTTGEVAKQMISELPGVDVEYMQRKGLLAEGVDPDATVEIYTVPPPR